MRLPSQNPLNRSKLGSPGLNNCIEIEYLNEAQPHLKEGPSVDDTVKLLELIEKYAWVIPSQEALNVLVRNGPILEVGAGSGYWAYLVKKKGGDIVATTAKSLQTDDRHHSPEKAWTEVEDLDALTAVEKYSRGRALLLCRPPHKTDMAYKAAKRYIELGGRKIIYIGETRNGCCADNDFFDLLSARTKRTKRVVLPLLPTGSDHLNIYEISPE